MGDFVHEPISGASFGVLTVDEHCQKNVGSLTVKSWRKWIWDNLKEQAKQNSEMICNLFH